MLHLSLNRRLCWLLVIMVVLIGLAAGFYLVRQTLHGSSAARGDAGWHLVAKNDMASVQVQKMLYDTGPKSRWLIRIRVTNVSDGVIGLALGEYYTAIQPNSWGEEEEPRKDHIPGIRMQCWPMTTAGKTRLIEDFKAARLVQLEKGQSLDYYHEFNGDMDGPRPTGALWTYISLQGQVKMTDGTRVAQIACNLGTDLYLPPGVRWARIPAGSLVFSERKASGIPSITPLAKPASNSAPPDADRRKGQE